MAMHRPRHAAPATRSPWRPVALAVVAVVALASSAGGVYALLRATATATQTAGTGTLLLTQTANGTFGTAITGAAPGDTVHRFVRLTNTGTLPGTALTAGITAAAPNELSNGPSATALRVTITECSQAWTVTGPAGICATPIATPVVDVQVPFTGRALAAGTLAPEVGVRHLRISFTVPDNNETSLNGVPPTITVQGKSTALTLTFTEEQRTATVTAS